MTTSLEDACPYDAYPFQLVPPAPKSIPLVHSLHDPTTYAHICQQPQELIGPLDYLSFYLSFSASMHRLHPGANIPLWAD